MPHAPATGDARPVLGHVSVSPELPTNRPPKTNSSPCSNLMVDTLIANANLEEYARSLRIADSSMRRR